MNVRESYSRALEQVNLPRRTAKQNTFNYWSTYWKILGRCRDNISRCFHSGGKISLSADNKFRYSLRAIPSLLLSPNVLSRIHWLNSLICTGSIYTEKGKTFLPGFGNGWLKYCSTVHFWDGQGNIFIGTWQECFLHNSVLLWEQYAPQSMPILTTVAVLSLWVWGRERREQTRKNLIKARPWMRNAGKWLAVERINISMCSI